MLDARTPKDLFILDPEGCESCISLTSDLGFVTVDILLLEFYPITVFLFHYFGPSLDLVTDLSGFDQF